MNFAVPLLSVVALSYKVGDYLMMTSMWAFFLAIFGKHEIVIAGIR